MFQYSILKYTNVLSSKGPCPHVLHLCSKVLYCSNVLGFNVLCFNVPSFNDLYSNVLPSVLIIFVLMLRILYSNVLCSVF